MNDPTLKKSLREMVKNKKSLSKFLNLSGLNWGHGDFKVIMQLYLLLQND